MGKQYEYMLNVVERYEEAKLDIVKRNGKLERQEKYEGDLVSFMNKLGKEGWDFSPSHVGFMGKREIPQTRTNSYDISR